MNIMPAINRWLYLIENLKIYTKLIKNKSPQIIVWKFSNNLILSLIIEKIVICGL